MVLRKVTYRLVIKAWSRPIHYNFLFKRWTGQPLNVTLIKVI